MVTAAIHRHVQASRQTSHPLWTAGKFLLVALVGVSLVAGTVGGLLRAGVDLGAVRADWPGHAALSHAALMICGFLGTVIGLERAVAVKLRFAFLAPLASGLAGLGLLLGWGHAAWLTLLAALVFVGVNIVVVRRQFAAHTALLLVAALCWLAGNALFASGAPGALILPWWFAFVVMTIAAERLEMTRLMRRRPGARSLLYGVLAGMLAGAAAGSLWPVAAGVLYGLSLALLALWLMVFDIARRTVTTDGLSRFMAVCLLGGYGWLAVAGAAWAATALGMPLRDTALHALGLGFIVSMMMGHAPVILPAVARVKLHFSAWFYLPLAALHASLALRLAGGFDSLPLRSLGAALNAAAMVLFALTVLAAALQWRRRHSGKPPQTSHHGSEQR